VNIPVGASFIKKLEIQWNNQFIPTVASYNASDKAIRGWLQTRFKGDSIEFIEDIPYEETRGYVRLVIRNLIFYQLMAADGQKIAFPDWVLKLEPLAPAI
jgi:soluble lytic murein transglycosylase